MYAPVLAAQIAALSLLDRVVARAAELVRGPDVGHGRGHADRGQSTAEYALVLLGAATVALVFIAWAGKSSRIGNLFNTVLDTVIGKV